MLLARKRSHVSSFYSVAIDGFSKPKLLLCHTSLLGVNVPDHDMTFQSLSELLQQSVTPHVASVQAKECGGKGLEYSKKVVTVIVSSCLRVLTVVA